MGAVPKGLGGQPWEQVEKWPRRPTHAPSFGPVSGGDDKHRRRLERSARLMDLGADLTGPLAGGAIGLVGGPLGVLAGSAVGLGLQKGLARLGAEFEQRHLGPREKARVGAALYWALEDINRRLDDGEEPRSDGFVDADEDERPRADELLEAVLVSAQRDHEEYKLRHLGWLYASILFDEDVEPSDADFLIELASDLTYAQLALISLFHNSPYRSLPSWGTMHPFEWRAHILAAQLFDLARRGLLSRTDGGPVRDHGDVDPGELWVGVLGCRLYDLLRLEELEDEAIEQADEQVRLAAALDTPWELVDKLANHVDAVAISEDDIEHCAIRLPLDERVRALLPEPGSTVHGSVRGSQFVFSYELAENEADVGVLRCRVDRYRRDEFHARVGLDDVLRVASVGHNELTID